MMYVIAFLFFFILSLLAAGIHWFGPRIFKAKVTYTIDTLEGAVSAIISWSQANNQLPVSSTFPTIVKNPNDTNGQPLYYVYDNNLTSISTGGLCGRTSTSLSVNFCPNAQCTTPTTTIQNVAFIVFSKGNNLNVETTLNGSFNGAAFNAPIPGSGYAAGNINIYDPSVSINNHPYDDITRIVTLNELQSRARCSGVTRGSLRILNNELPHACSGNEYAATLYPDGGAPNNGIYQWSWSGLPPGTGSTINASSGPPLTVATLALSGIAPAYISGPNNNYPVTITLQDYNTPPNVVQRNYVLSVMNCSGSTNAQGAPIGGGNTGGINMGSSNPGGGSNSSDSTNFSNNIVNSGSNAPPSAAPIAVVNNVIEFGFNVGNGAACIWYPGNFPLLGKTMRAFWNFCFHNVDYSADSRQWADGYTFSIMQAYNPTTFCGTGATNDPTVTPYNCKYGGALGEFLSYCGLPGQNMAVEFDIYPNNGALTRNDPPNNDNHVAIVQALDHPTIATAAANGPDGPPSPGLFGDNTHGAQSGSPSGAVSGAGAVNNPSCAAANAVGSGCLYGIYGNGANNNVPVTWMEDGCNGAYTNHNARVEIHTRCNSNCSSCYSDNTSDHTSNCSHPAYAYTKVWIDKGNDNLGSDEPSTPDVSYCFILPAAMDQVKVGFTEGTGASNQLGFIANFRGNFFGACNQPAIATTSGSLLTTGACPGTTTPVCTTAIPCLCGTVGCVLSSQLTAGGGVSPYTWSLGAANLRDPAGSNTTAISSSTLPPGLSLQTTNTYGGYDCAASNAHACIYGTPTTVGTYNTILASVTDGCTSDCSQYNTVSQSYIMNFQLPTTPTCTLTANPSTVAYNGTSTLSWTITTCAATNATWTGLPAGGTCTSFSNSSAGNCTTGSFNSPGAQTIQLTANDAGGSNTCSTTVTVGCPALSITTPSPLPYGIQGVAYTTTVTSSSTVAPYTWSASSWPPGTPAFSIAGNTTTGTISGTPTAAGNYTPTINLKDSCPNGVQSASQIYSLVIKHATYTIYNETGATIYPQIGGTCTNGNRIANGGTYSIAYNAAAVNFYPGRTGGNACTGTPVSVSGNAALNADANNNGNVQITSPSGNLTLGDF